MNSNSHTGLFTASWQSHQLLNKPLSELLCHNRQNVSQRTAKYVIETFFDRSLHFVKVCGFGVSSVRGVSLVRMVNFFGTVEMEKAKLQQSCNSYIGKSRQRRWA